MSELVELYFQTSYHASLLLHKKRLLESLATGSATPHVILAICASAAKYAKNDYYSVIY
jgi:hypothetical protein